MWLYRVFTFLLGNNIIALSLPGYLPYPDISDINDIEHFCAVIEHFIVYVIESNLPFPLTAWTNDSIPILTTSIQTYLEQYNESIIWPAELSKIIGSFLNINKPYLPPSNDKVFDRLTKGSVFWKCFNHLEKWKHNQLFFIGMDQIKCYYNSPNLTKRIKSGIFFDFNNKVSVII